MTDQAALQALRDEIAELRDVIVRRRKGPRDRRPQIVFRVTQDEYGLINQAATQRGVCVSDLMRIALEPVIGTALRQHREIPSGLRKTLLSDRPDKSSASWLPRKLDRQGITAGIAERERLRDADAAVMADRRSRVQGACPAGGLSEPTSHSSLFRR